MLVLDYRTKKALKESVGESLRYEETSFHGPEYVDNGPLCGGGPSAYQRKWSARVEMANGKIAKVA